jgi:hypothetical protein
MSHPELLSIHYFEYTSDITLENTNFPSKTHSTAKEAAIYDT